ncbi:MAG TPA: hypothetical protein VHF26_16590 [Trebonia sp.]|nr:hypothetical protein [Trebonia sp.]
MFPGIHAAHSRATVTALTRPGPAPGSRAYWSRSTNFRILPEAAWGWGFRDAAVFSRVFRAAYGLPPVEYRAVHQ